MTEMAGSRGTGQPMSKAATQHHESRLLDSLPTGSSTRPDSSMTELQSQGPFPRDASLDETQHFAEAHRLTHHLDLLQKAAVIVQGETQLDSVTGLTTSEKLALQDETERKWRQPKMLYFTILVCSIGAIEQGWAQTGMNGANLYFPRAFGIDSDSQRDNFIVGLINGGIYFSTGLL